MQVKKIRAILIDDDPENSEVLELMLDRVCLQVEIVAKCNSANAAIEAIQQHQPDLIFLDIEMPVKDGFEVLKVFESALFKVIVVTGHEQYALRAIKYAAIDYVLKPVDMNELVTAIKKVEEDLLRKDSRLETFSKFLAQDQKTIEKIIIPSTKGFRTIALIDIESIKAESGNYCLFKLTDGSLSLVTKPLSYFEELLPSTDFFRIHRSHIINLSKVVAFDRSVGKIKLENGDLLEVSFRRRADFYCCYKKFIG